MMTNSLLKSAINGAGIIAKRCNWAHAIASNGSANGFAPFGGKINAIVFGEYFSLIPLSNSSRYLSTNLSTNLSTEFKILKAIKEHPKMAQPEIAARVGVGKTTVQNAIVRFKKMGILIRRGSNKAGCWEVTLGQGK